jgi:hypothetical protein
VSLNTRHITIVEKIDARVKELELKGCDEVTIFKEMEDMMPEFKTILEMDSRGDIEYG